MRAVALGAQQETTPAYRLGDGAEWYCFPCVEERDPDNDRAWKVFVFASGGEVRVCAGGCRSFVEGDRAA